MMESVNHKLVDSKIGLSAMNKYNSLIQYMYLFWFDLLSSADCPWFEFSDDWCVKFSAVNSEFFWSDEGGLSSSVWFW